MIYWAYILLSVAVAAGLMGFGGEGGAAAILAQALFFVFLSVAVMLIAIKLSREAGGDTTPSRQHVPDRRH